MSKVLGRGERGKKGWGILEWKRGNGHRLTVTTTTEHLAQRLGRALEKAFSGDVLYDFSHENKLARVKWRREGN